MVRDRRRELGEAGERVLSIANELMLLLCRNGFFRIVYLYQG